MSRKDEMMIADTVLVLTTISAPTTCNITTLYRPKIPRIRGNKYAAPCPANPDPLKPKMAGTHRNQMCRCGCGRKAKRCEEGGLA